MNGLEGEWGMLCALGICKKDRFSFHSMHIVMWIVLVWSIIVYHPFVLTLGIAKIPLHFESSEFVEFWLLECHRKCLGCLEYFPVVGDEMYKAVNGNRIAVNAVNNVQNIIYYVTSVMRRSAWTLGWRQFQWILFSCERLMSTVCVVSLRSCPWLTAVLFGAKFVASVHCLLDNRFR